MLHADKLHSEKSLTSAHLSTFIFKQPYFRSRMIKLSIKILISVAILILIARAIDLTAVYSVVRSMQVKYLFLALLMQMLSAALASYRWYLIMRRLKFEQGPMFYLKSYLKGTFFNQALPGGIGGDAYRVLESAGLGKGKKSGFLWGSFRSVNWPDRVAAAQPACQYDLSGFVAHPYFPYTKCHCPRWSRGYNGICDAG